MIFTAKPVVGYLTKFDSASNKVIDKLPWLKLASVSIIAAQMFDTAHPSQERSKSGFLPMFCA